jgi:hypothetical protein
VFCKQKVYYELEVSAVICIVCIYKCPSFDIKEQVCTRFLYEHMNYAFLGLSEYQSNMLRKKETALGFQHVGIKTVIVNCASLSENHPVERLNIVTQVTRVKVRYRYKVAPVSTTTDTYMILKRLLCGTASQLYKFTLYEV